MKRFVAAAPGSHPALPRPSNPAHPAVIAALDLARRTGLPVSQRTIRATFESLPDWPRLRLAEVQEVFDRLGVPSAAFRTDPVHLRTLPLPLLTQLVESDGDEVDTATMVVLTGWEADSVRMVHPLFGEQAIAWDIFLDRWRGVLFAASAEGAAPEPDYAELRDAELNALGHYRRSVRIVEEMFSRSECEAVIGYCEENELFARSVVQSQDEEARTFISYNRTSESALIRDRDRPFFASLYARVAALLAVSSEEIEDLQCVRYDPGQQFGAHVDGAHRTFTLLVYLNDGFEGGDTIFPDIDLVIRPRTGRGILFRNVDTEGEEIPWSRHRGAPPLEGRKYVCNMWVRCAASIPDPS